MKGTAVRDITQMAWRNLSRHRVKTVITATAVAVSVALYIAADAWLRGMNLDSRRNIVAYEIGAAKIQTKAYFASKDDLPMYESFSDWAPLARALEKAGYAVAPRFVFTGTLYSRFGSAPMVFNAVDPEAEPKVLRYMNYLEAGRFPRPGAFEIALGTLAAEKLRVGIPLRVSPEELEGELVAAARSPEEAQFIRALYAPRSREAAEGTQQRLALRDDASPAELERLWDILSASGRMNVRISTVIDMKELPDSIRKSRFEQEILPVLSPEGREALLRAYVEDPILGGYRLVAEDEQTRRRAMDALLAIDYSGAVRHVNQVIDALVVGIVNSPNPKTNGNVAYIPLDVLQDEAGLLLEGKVTELLVRAAGADDSRLPGPEESPAAIAAALERQGVRLPEELSIHGWLEYVEDYIAASQGDNITTRIMIILLFILSFLGIANTMLMAILERTKEIGMMRALGMSDGELALCYLLEAGMIGLIGSVAGMILGSLINVPMVAHGIDYSEIAKQMGGDFGYRITALFRSTWNTGVIFASGLVATILSGLLALPAILRSLKMPVTDSLRFE